MKKIIITIVVIAASAAGIAFVLTGNKKENEATMAIVSDKSGKVPVRTTKVVKEEINIDFSANGKLLANQDLMLMSEVNGRVLSIKVKEGDRVSQGQVLATVESTYSNIDYQTATAALEKLKVDQKRYESSLKSGGITQAQLDEINLAVKNAENQAAAAKKRLSDATIKSPISGVVNKKHIEVGSFVGGGSQLFDIVDVSSLKLKVAANERQVIQLALGTVVKVKVPAFADEEFTGKVSFIAPKADNSMNYPVEIKLDNSKLNKVKAGMYATATFEFGTQTPIITVPRSAFVGSVNSNKLYVLVSGKAVLREVASGMVFGDQVEILGGLNEGEVVITSGQINLVDGAEVEVMEK